MMAPRTIGDALQARLALLTRSGGNLDRERLVVAHGREFAGAARPKGYRRQWARKQCFRNAGTVASKGRGIYVEGYAFADTGLFEHAWITVDGVTAIDPTLPDGEQYQYFGVPLTPKTLSRLIVRCGYWGFLDLHGAGAGVAGLAEIETIIAAQGDLRFGHSVGSAAVPTEKLVMHQPDGR